MSLVVVELLNALKAAGVDEEKAEAAAAAVIGREVEPRLVTRADLDAGLAKLESRLIRWNVGTIIAMTAVFAAISKLL